MMLAAWNEGVVSCPNGMPEPERAAETLDLDCELLPVTVLSFGYPRRPQDPESHPADEWSREATRRSLEDVVKRI